MERQILPSALRAFIHNYLARKSVVHKTLRDAHLPPPCGYHTCMNEPEQNLT